MGHAAVAEAPPSSSRRRRLADGSVVTVATSQERRPDGGTIRERTLEFDRPRRDGTTELHERRHYDASGRLEGGTRTARKRDGRVGLDATIVEEFDSGGIRQRSSVSTLTSPRRSYRSAQTTTFRPDGTVATTRVQKRDEIRLEDGSTRTLLEERDLASAAGSAAPSGDVTLTEKLDRPTGGLDERSGSTDVIVRTGHEEAGRLTWSGLRHTAIRHAADGDQKREVRAYAASDLDAQGRPIPGREGRITEKSDTRGFFERNNPVRLGAAMLGIAGTALLFTPAAPIGAGLVAAGAGLSLSQSIPDLVADPSWGRLGKVGLDALGLVGPARMAVEGVRLARSGMTIADATASATRVVGATAGERVRSFLTKDPYLLGWVSRVAGTTVAVNSAVEAARAGELGLVHAAEIANGLKGSAREEDPGTAWEADFPDAVAAR